jgi:hypothetical protein
VREDIHLCAQSFGKHDSEVSKTAAGRSCQ